MPQLLNPAIFVLRPSTQLISYYSQFSKIYCIFTSAFSRTRALVGWCGVVSFINNDSSIQCSRHFRAKLFSRYFLAQPERSGVYAIIRPGLKSIIFGSLYLLWFWGFNCVSTHGTVERPWGKNALVNTFQTFAILYIYPESLEAWVQNSILYTWQDRFLQTPNPPSTFIEDQRMRPIQTLLVWT